MSYKLFLDDIRNPDWLYDDYNEWIVVRTPDDFKNIIIEKGVPDIISFDNDLGIDNLTKEILPDGYACLNWLIDNSYYIKSIIVHSDNIIANEQIYGKSLNWHKFLISEKILNSEDLFVLKRMSMNNLREEYKKRETN